jgi:SOS-response transcriptional repressor LexA
MNEKLGLTQRQAEALEFLRAFFAERGYSPSYAEIGRACGCNLSGVQRIVQALEDRGHVSRRRGAWRSISLL